MAPIRSRRPYMQILATKTCEGTRPGLETANAIYDLRRGLVKVDSAVFLLEQRRQSCLGIVLRLWVNGATFEPMQCLDHQFCTYGSHAWSQSLSSIFWRNRYFPLQEDIASVQSSVDAYCGHAGDGFAGSNGPLNQRGTTILRQKRGVQVDVPQWRQLHHPLRDDASVPDYDDCVWLESGKLCLKFVIVFDSLRLNNGQSEFARALLYWREGHLHASSARSVRLGHCQVHSESHVHQPLQRRHGELWSAAENKMDGVRH